MTAPYIPITFITDSKYAIEEWENNGWINVENSEYLRATVYQLRKRSAQMSFIWVKGHTGNHGNEQADRLANEGANKQEDDEIDLSIADEFNLQGAALGIRTKNKLTPRRKTTSNLDITRHALKNLTAIWKGCRNPDLPKKIQQFIFKTLHGAYRIGDYWTSIPTFEHRAKCSHCQAETETLEHILLECPNIERTTIWNLAKHLWPAKHGEWPQITLGIIMGCGNINKIPQDQQNEENQTEQRRENKKGAMRLLRILISESAHLNLGPEMRQNDKRHATFRTINKQSRLQTDRMTAKKIIHKEKYTNLVTSTWSDIITTNTNHNKNWAIALEVLVGITLPRPSTNEAPR
ncbi:RnaseH-domain-containing protein [Suillus occidentalis]|nr:RnaseH-domain-containing protein [Suillus occidentalis]